VSFIKLDEKHQKDVDNLYELESMFIKTVDMYEIARGKNRWLSIGRTDIEKGFMALRKGIVEQFKESLNAPE
jgi:hypothetical protein